MFICNLLHTILALNLSTAAALDDQSLLKPFPAETLLNEIVVFSPQQNHHFNLKSKNSCGSARTIKIEEGAIECQMTKVGENKVELYICDDKQSYCRREEIALKTPSPSDFKGWVGYYWNSFFAKDNWQAPFKSGVSHNKVARGFSTDFESALARSQKENKLILAYFTQLSCPPCRMMRELTLASDEFQEITKNFILLQIDVDLDIAPEKLKPLAIRSTPTMTVLNKEFQELDRRRGPMSNLKFKQWLANLKIETLPIAEIKDVEVLKENMASAKSQNTLNYEKLRLLFATLEKDDAKATKTLLEKLTTPSGVIEIDSLIRINKANAMPEPYQELSSIPYKSLRCEGVALTELSYSIGEHVLNTAAAKDEAKFKKALNELEEMQQYIGKPAGDAMQCAYLQQGLISLKLYVAEKTGNAELKRQTCLEALKNFDRFPRLTGVSETTQMEMEKAECAEDTSSKAKLITTLKDQNTKDYSYDFLEAAEALGAKNYDLALNKIDESLKVATDRSWQKAFLLKMDILAAMGKKEAAKSEIMNVLSQLNLPASEFPKVHTFTQNLRAKQREFR